MEFNIEIWLKGNLFSSDELFIPDHDERMSRPEQIIYRESLIEAAVIKMKALYHRQIDKCYGIYCIYIIVPSKMEFQPQEYERDNGEDERQNENSADADDRDSQ